MQVQGRVAELERLGARALVISYAPPEALASYRDHLSLTFDLASDPDRSAYASYGLTRLSFWHTWHPKALARYAVLMWRGHKLRRPSGEDDISQLGGDFVVDRRGILRFIHVTDRPDDRPPVATLLAALEEASR